MGKRVLVVDGQVMVAELVGMSLAGLGLSLQFAHDGREALHCCLEQAPDLVISDIRLPSLDGLTLCRALKQDPATQHAQVMILTGMAQDTDRHAACLAGADIYITKPFSPTVLRDQVERMLRENNAFTLVPALAFA